MRPVYVYMRGKKKMKLKNSMVSDYQYLPCVVIEEEVGIALRSAVVAGIVEVWQEVVDQVVIASRYHQSN